MKKKRKDGVSEEIVEYGRSLLDALVEEIEKDNAKKKRRKLSSKQSR